ncbi:hypothetical protein [Burkholderia cenocepacia]|uniref:hypothetical protein n=1 Tax=Burkholderia cenocepacia TaxID=95486 RepID=UPI000AB71B8D|nr:hypothetical protein [Burkholderia cenocepacia]
MAESVTAFGDYMHLSGRGIGVSGSFLRKHRGVSFKNLLEFIYKARLDSALVSVKPLSEMTNEEIYNEVVEADCSSHPLLGLSKVGTIAAHLLYQHNLNVEREKAPV